jgi:hypothetical protein
MQPQRSGRLAFPLGVFTAVAIAWSAGVLAGTAESDDRIGREVAIQRHLADGEEFTRPLRALLTHGQRLFDAVWTLQEGGGRPLTKGDGTPLTDPTSPLVFPRNFNRLSAPDSNGCVTCHSIPFSGGGGHFGVNAFIPAQRFDFITFDRGDLIPLRGTVDERGVAPNLQAISNAPNSLGMVGSGFIEMLARQITADLQRIRDGIPRGGSRVLRSKGIGYGTLRRNADGTWNTSRVEGISELSLVTTGPNDPPTLAILPFHQASLVTSLREFSNNAFNHHHGVQSAERFGPGQDPDGDGFTNELTRADVTAVSVFQATLAVPGRVIPNDPAIEAAVRTGERAFRAIRCTDCHLPSLPLTDEAWIFTEPNPFNPVGNLQPGEAPEFRVNLTSNALPLPRLAVNRGVVHVPAFTDLKLHDITTGPSDPNCQPINQRHPAGSAPFFTPNCKFLTKKLWGSANEPPFFNHGQFVTLREAVMAHAGEAAAVMSRFRALTRYEQDSIIEFLKTLQVLPPGTRHLVVDEHGRAKSWSSEVEPTR